MRSLVLDASAGLKLVRHEEGSDDVGRLVSDRLPGEIAVPELFWLEVVNVLARRHGYSGAQVMEAVRELDALGIRTITADRPSLLVAIDLVERHGLTAYDAAYLAVALALDAHLATADRRLATAAGQRALFIGPERGIGEDRTGYAESAVTWPSWPDAGAYLAELRSGELGA